MGEDSESVALIKQGADADAKQGAQTGSGYDIQWIMNSHIYLGIGDGERPYRTQPGPFADHVPEGDEAENTQPEVVSGMVRDKTKTGTAMIQ